jgi:hypothetical protein
MENQMKIDGYTKFLLTIITLCLLYLCLNDLIRIPRVNADSPISVVLVDGDGTPIAGHKTYAGPASPLRVELEQK